MRLRGKHVMGPICHTGVVISLPVQATGTLFATGVWPPYIESIGRSAGRVTEWCGEGTLICERLQVAHTYMSPPVLC